jgi:hypothetical protein
MRLLCLPAWVALFLLAACGASRPDQQPPPKGGAAGAAATDPALRLIPTGSVRVDVLQLTAPPRLLELTGKFQQAIGKDPEWWLNYARQAKPGQPLAYHPKLGLTRAEYDEFLRLGKQMVVKKAGEGTITVRALGDGRFTLDGGQTAPELTGIEIDLKKNAVRTPYGTATDRGEIRANRATQTATGPWSGVVWKYEKQGAVFGTGTSASLAFGRPQESGKGILYYQVTRIEPGAQPLQITRVLTYDLPGR